MELWIRNQDKTRLTRVNDLYLVHDENNTCDYIGSNMVGHLAKYTTPGRALEVLNKISKLVENAMYHTQLNNEVLFYQMPEKEEDL